MRSNQLSYPAKFAFCREDVTRTRDPYVPNVVRYQLRHFSIPASFQFSVFTFHFSKAAAKVLLFFDMCKFFANYFALFRLKPVFAGLKGSFLAIISRTCSSVSDSGSTVLAI